MSAAAATAAPVRGRRTLEIVLVGLGIIAAVVTMGGFTLVMNQVDQATFEAVVMPALLGGDTALDPLAAREAGDTLAAWFGVSLVLLLLLSAAGIALARSRPWRRTPAWWFLAAGLVCLLGSQLVLYPVAFLFLLAAALVALRPLPEGSPR
ncbi:hypothetical protein NLU66_05010 [Brachybacterium sp. NBEC-018]|uniref:hypothetical protein n=1 Tax=Brachybacterium sp. NBEC-018 TaxID=2996004 RepID=UPI0021750EB5|nr:hypothetical protein [Brachybacterium sp. NBEC-018]UVY84964.1 hypothetical protein NLU66_05010 [Brachybacterium sp. NBEC-018]